MDFLLIKQILELIHFGLTFFFLDKMTFKAFDAIHNPFVN